LPKYVVLYHGSFVPNVDLDPGKKIGKQIVHHEVSTREGLFIPKLSRRRRTCECI
jgi:hypothetical protein